MKVILCHLRLQSLCYKFHNIYFQYKEKKPKLIKVELIKYHILKLSFKNYKLLYNSKFI